MGLGIGLVLGGGAARGFAHVGVLRALRERDLEPEAIAACSMGGILGALWAAGYGCDALERLLVGDTFVKSLQLGRRGGLLSAGGLARAVPDGLPARIEDLKIPLRVVAVDVQTGELRVIEEGPLAAALQATSAFPGVLEPTRSPGGAYLVDGGVLNDLPVDHIRDLTDGPVVAVDVSPPVDYRLDFDPGFWRRAKNVLTLRARPLGVDVLLKSFTIPQTELTRRRLDEHPPDVLVVPDLSPDFRLEHFHRRDEAIEAGYRSAAKELDAWLAGSSRSRDADAP